MQKYTDIDNIKKAIEYFGSQINWAKSLGIPKQCINSWLKGTVDIPLKYAIKTEYLTNGDIKAVDLRELF